jgi:hypothetical protein
MAEPRRIAPVLVSVSVSRPANYDDGKRPRKIARFALEMTRRCVETGHGLPNPASSGYNASVLNSHAENTFIASMLYSDGPVHEEIARAMAEVDAIDDARDDAHDRAITNSIVDSIFANIVERARERTRSN